MGLNPSTTSKILVIGALTLCSYPTEGSDYSISKPTTQVENEEFVEVFNTQTDKFDYVDEKYSLEVNEVLNVPVIDLNYFNFVQELNFEQKEIDSEILQALNDFQKIVGKKVPSRKRL
jgi:hypothetical protein